MNDPTRKARSMTIAMTTDLEAMWEASEAVNSMPSLPSLPSLKLLCGCELCKPVAFIEPEPPRSAPLRLHRLDPQIKRRWLRELRSGGWVQVRHSYTNGAFGRCAMGVLREIMGGAFYNEGAELGLTQLGYMLLHRSIVERNDQRLESFAEIADYIEREW